MIRSTKQTGRTTPGRERLGGILEMGTYMQAGTVTWSGRSGH
ncbi:hypothetical protein [Natrinema gelatinilyticum]|nr:hypothetical protein [Natrinema gelatinilyticum]